MKFEIGDRVEHLGKKSVFYGLAGTVEIPPSALDWIWVGVKFDNVPEAVWNCKAKDLKLLSKAEATEVVPVKRIVELQEQLQKKENTIKDLEKQLRIKDEIIHKQTIMMCKQGQKNKSDKIFS